jgi:hypothetical protein
VTVSKISYVCRRAKYLYNTARVKKFMNVIYFFIALLLYIYVGTFDPTVARGVFARVQV